MENRLKHGCYTRGHGDQLINDKYSNLDVKPPSGKITPVSLFNKYFIVLGNYIQAESPPIITLQSK